jgi:hypothetical protein
MANYNINAVTRRVVYTGSAGVGPYAFSFEILTQTDVDVYFNDTLLTITTDYTVTINANGTGSVTIVTGTNVPTTPDADDQITIVGARDIERVTDFVTAGDFRASAINEQLDALTIFDQQLAEADDRTVKAPVTDPTSIDMTLPKKADRASKFLLFSATGDVGVASTDTLTVSTLQAFTDYQVDTFTGDNTTVVFTLSAEPGQKGNTQVYFDGVYQAKVNYSLVGTALTFTTAPATGVKVEVVHGQAASTYTPDDGSIAFAKLASAAIDTDLSSVSASDDTLPTAKATKTYVDAQIGANNELSEVLANGNTSGGTNIVVSAGDSITTDTIAETTAAAGVTIDGVLVKDGEVDGRDVSVDGTKLDTVETSADVTDTANVTAAGALMDSELTNITAVKALNQGVATTDSPSFAGLTATTADINGGTIDGAVIGGSSAAAGTFTTFTSTGIDDNASSTALTIDSSGNLNIGDFSPPTITGSKHVYLDGSYGIKGSATTNNGIYFARHDSESTVRRMMALAAGSNSFVIGDSDVGYVQMNVDGTAMFRFDTTSFRAEDAAGPALMQEAATSTNPTLIPNRGDLNTGMGSYTSDVLSLIAGGVESLRVGEGGSAEINALLADDVNGLRITATNATYTTNVIQPFVTRAASSAFDFIEAVTSAGAAVTYRLRGDGVHHSGNGSLSSPAYSFISDTNSGIYWISADNWSIVAGATDILAVNTSGLTLYGGRLTGSAANGPVVANETASTTNPTLIPRGGDYTTGVGSGASGNLSLITVGAEAMRIDGNRDTDFIGGGVKVSGSLSTATTNSIALDQAGSVSRIRTFGPSVGNACTIQIEQADSAGTTQQFPLIISSSGNVGIGGAPAKKLDVSAGDIRLDDGYTLQWGGTNNRFSGSNASNFLQFVTSGVEAMRIESSGNLTMANAAGPALMQEGATSTNPTLVPHRGDLDTGIGWSSANELSVIAAGSETIRVGSSTTQFFGPVRLRSYTVAGLPASSAGDMAYCSDETGGAVPVFSDGTNWRRVTDRAIAS